MQMTVVFASAGFQRVLGFESERLLGKDFVAVRPFSQSYQYIRACVA
jgi:hypothetical protein